MTELAAHFHNAWATFGIAGLAGFWVVKLGLTVMFYRLMQKKTGHRGPTVFGWFHRHSTGKRAGHVTNGH